MKLNLIIVHTLVLIANTYATEFKVKASARVRSEISNNLDLNSKSDDKTSQNLYRFRMQLNVKKENSSKTSIFIEPQFSKIAGDTRGGTTQTSGSQNKEDSFDAHQAYIKHNFSKSMSLQVGRQEMAYGDQLLIGNVGWDNIGRAFDGYKIACKSELGITDIFSMTLKEESPYTSSNRDYELNGLYHQVNMKLIDTLDMYYLSKQDYSENITKPKAVVNAFGFRAKSRLKNFDYRLEYTFEKTDKNEKNRDATQYDLEIGYQIGKVRVSGELSMASEHFDQLYPTAHKWLGYMDLFKRQNISEKAIRINYKQNDKTSYNFAFHIFEITEIDSSTNTYNWSGPNVTNNEKDLGTEIDFVIIHKLTNELSIVLKQAYFTPGQHYKSADLNKSASKTFLQMETTF